ncbi:hypothetical protein ACOSQ4_023815 [Xanthoceras sorbifolium]
MTAFKISRAALHLLKQIVSKLAALGDTATFNFCPEGVLLVSSSHDGHIIALRINIENLNHFICSQRYSIGVNLDQLSTILNLVGNEDSVDITTCDEWFQFIFQIENSEGQKTCRNIEFIPPNPMHVLLDSMPHHHVVKAVITAPVFTLFFFGHPPVRINDKIAVTLTKRSIHFTSTRINLCFYKFTHVDFEGFTEDDDGPYQVEYNFHHMRSLEETFYWPFSLQKNQKLHNTFSQLIQKSPLKGVKIKSCLTKFLYYQLIKQPSISSIFIKTL